MVLSADRANESLRISISPISLARYFFLVVDSLQNFGNVGLIRFTDRHICPVSMIGADSFFFWICQQILPTVFVH